MGEIPIIEFDSALPQGEAKETPNTATKPTIQAAIVNGEGKTTAWQLG